MALKIRYIFKAVFLLLLVNNISAQDWTWSHHFNTSKPSIIAGLDADDEMNLFVTGQFKADIDIGAASDIAVQSNTDFFLAKYDSSGSYQWHKHAYGSIADIKVNSKNVAIDNNNDVIVTGFYNGPVTGDLVVDTPTGTDAFLAKYNGTTQAREWSFRAAYGPGDVKSQYVSVDPNGNIYLTGFSDTTIYIGDTILYNSDRNIQNFVAKFTSEGVFVWATQIRTSSNDSKFIEISSPNSNEIYVAGFFTDTLYADAIKVWTPTTADNNGVIIKINGNGTTQWIRMTGGTGDDRCNGVSTDNNGNVYATGYISGTATFDSLGNGSQESSPLVSKGGFDLYVAKYNPAGRLQWKFNKGSTGNDIGYGAYVFENIVQFSGYFSDTLYFNSDTIASTGVSDQDAAFFVYNTDGDPISGQSVQGTAFDKSELLTYDNAGHTYFGVVFQSPVLNFGDSTYTNGAGTKNNAVFGKFEFEFSSTWTQSKHVTCPGGNDGELIATTYFGSGPYTYVWSSPDTNTIEANDSFAYNLTAGTYTVKITDVNSKITTTIPFTIKEPDAISITRDSTNLSCFQSNNGTITISSITGGTAPYAYAWSGPSGDDPTNPNQISLNSGIYSLIVTDDNYCTAFDTIEITQPMPIYFGNVEVVAEEPAGSKSGSIKLEVSGGVPTYNYAWVYNTIDSLIGRTHDTINNLAEGDYKAYVTDINACVADTIVTISGNPFRVGLFGTDVSCFDSTNGSAYATIISGLKAFPVTYTFTDNLGNPIAPISDSIIQNLQPGKYYVLAQEVGGEGRTSSDSVIISKPEVIIIGLDADSTTCFSSTNGLINLTISGGVIPYNYSWSNGASSKNISNLTAGEYIVTVTDGNGCVIIATDTVYEPDSIQANISVIQEISCHGSLNGALISEPTGGTQPYIYAWDDARTQITSIASNLSVGTYTVSIVDENGCFNTGTYELEQPEPLIIASVDSSNITCYNNGDGRIAVEITGGTEPMSYTWSFGLADTNVVENLPAASYSLSVKDAHDCTNDMLKVIIERPSSELVINEDIAAHTDNICFDGTIGNLAVIASGGWTTTSYEYSLDETNWVSSPIFSGLVAQQYSVSVRDGNACIESVNIEITEAPEIIVTESVIGNTFIATALGGTSPLAYMLNGTSTPQATGQFDNLDNGTYFVDVTDDNNCGPISSNSLEVLVTGVNETLNIITSIYPNPSKGIFKLEIEVPDNGEFNIEIYSISGAKVYNKVMFAEAKQYKRVDIDLSDKAKGIYLVKVNGIVLNTKLIIE